jgi:hypothetical protein
MGPYPTPRGRNAGPSPRLQGTDLILLFLVSLCLVGEKSPIDSEVWLFDAGEGFAYNEPASQRGDSVH